MNVAFAYSGAMQLILTGITFLASFINMYLMTRLIAAVYYEPIGDDRRALAAMLGATLLIDVWIYGIYLLGGRMSFPPAVYYAVGTVNPMFSLLYYHIGVKALGLPASHSVRLMGHVHLYYLLGTAICRLASSLFFQQDPSGPYNYLLDATKQLMTIGILVLMYCAVLMYQRRTGFYISLSDKASPNIRRDVGLYMLRASFAYLLAVIVPLTVQEQVMANALLSMIYALLLALDVQIDVRKAMYMRLENKKVHINALHSSMEAFSQVKHDFYNILQTYQGYISMGDLDQLKRYHATLVDSALPVGNSMALNAQLEAHPVLTPLLRRHMDDALAAGVKMFIDIQPGLSELYMDTADLCLVMDSLLSNAIHAAQRSEARRVFFSLERKGEVERLITITNSTDMVFDNSLVRWPGVSGKPIEPKAGLIQIRDILLSYGNCTFHGAYYDREYTAYLAIRPPV